MKTTYNNITFLLVSVIAERLVGSVKLVKNRPILMRPVAFSPTTPYIKFDRSTIFVESDAFLHNLVDPIIMTRRSASVYIQHVYAKTG